MSCTEGLVHEWSIFEDNFTQTGDICCTLHIVTPRNSVCSFLTLCLSVSQVANFYVPIPPSASQFEKVPKVARNSAQKRQATPETSFFGPCLGGFSWFDSMRVFQNVAYYQPLMCKVLMFTDTGIERHCDAQSETNKCISFYPIELTNMYGAICVLLKDMGVPSQFCAIRTLNGVVM